MTEVSGGHGPEFDGNSILLHLGDLMYVFVGHCAMHFEAYAPLDVFVSPVGNNDVPYAYAKDCDGRYYLFTFRVVLVPGVLTTSNCDPNDYYSEHSDILDCTPPFEGICGFRIGDEAYALTYVNDAETDYMRITAPGFNGSLTNEEELKVVFTKTHKTTHKTDADVFTEVDTELDLFEYVDLMSRYASYAGFCHLIVRKYT